MRRKEPRPGQVGNFWVSKKPGRAGPDDPWCRTWYQSRQTRRVSLGTSDFRQATIELANWAILNDRPSHAPTNEVFIEQVMLTYWEDHAKHLASHLTQRYNLRFWQKFWSGKMVADITPNEQRAFREYIGAGKMRSSSVDRVLASGRAALKYAVKQQMIDSVPHIFFIETHDEKLSREPMGRPITPREMAMFFDHIEARHLFVMTMFAATTLARPGAIFDMTRAQFDGNRNVLALNPPGRKQTKKHRPTIMVPPTLRPWLEHEANPEAYYVALGGKKITGGLKTTWGRTIQRAGLPGDLSPYSFRHGMAREMRDRGVPMDQISHILGHKPQGTSSTTAIYARFRPEYCVEAVAAIEDIMAEVRKHLKVADIDNPDAEFTGRVAWSGHLDTAALLEMHEMIASGLKGIEIARRIGVSSTAIYKHIRKLRRGTRER